MKNEILLDSKIKSEEKEKEKSSTKKKRGSKSDDLIINTKNVLLEKFIFELHKTKLENLKKNNLIKVEYKNTKDPNVIKIEIKSSDLKLLEKTYNEINIIQKYLSLNLSEKDRFLQDEEGLCLKAYINLFKISSYRIFKLDEENVSLQLIGTEKGIEVISNLIEEYVQAENRIKEKENELK